MEMNENIDVVALGSTGVRWRLIASPAGVLIAAAILLGASPAFGQSCPPELAVTVNPDRTPFTASVMSGTQVVFSVGPAAVTCASSSFQGGVPEAGRNVGDPVVLAMSPPKCPDCVTSNGMPVAAETNAANGQWSISTTCSGRATVRIPKAGAVARVGGCTMTMAPHRAVDVPATWSNGSPSRLTIDAVVPIASSGTGCPPSSTVTFKVTYGIANATDATKPITVTDIRRSTPTRRPGKSN
jgi:hypothetical protein